MLGKRAAAPCSRSPRHAAHGPAASPARAAGSPALAPRHRRCSDRRERTRMAAGRDNAVADWVEANLGTKVASESFNGGSGWSSAYSLTMQDGRKLFVKTARGRDGAAMFEGEAVGLRAMHGTGAIGVPRVLHVGPLGSNGGAFIVMDHLELGGGGGGAAGQAALGRALAAMHLAVPKDEQAAAGWFGAPLDNTIGGTPQPNGWSKDWVEFYRDRRLGHMLKLAGDTKLSRLGDKLLPNLGVFFEGAGPIRPSVLHGDLWSGNIGFQDGQPVIFDPAFYYGHHEAEFGMSWCAGFSRDFWDAYHSVIPRAPGFEERHQLYQLYHYLNHYVLFGGGYYSSAAGIMERLVAKL